uniref:uncharacterized protein LOC117608297 n=1 Tax=Osmia lignaria TaxID=473952 RepID=UPI0014788DA0|nr:uncharacterized protein LOC117608297 [Osmia lignaria]
MSSSTVNVLKDKSIQEEIRSDSTMVRKPVKIVGASPLENNRTKECNELKTERKDPKKDEETEKRKISQLQNENLPKTQKQDSKLKIVESKTIVTKKETKKTEVVVPKVSSSTTATQTFVPEFKMIPISSTSVSLKP